MEGVPVNYLITFYNNKYIIKECREGRKPSLPREVFIRKREKTKLVKKLFT